MATKNSALGVESRDAEPNSRGPTGSPKREKEKVRLSLDISPELNSLLEELAAAIGGTKSEVLRKAIALMEVMVDAKKQGKKFGIAEKDQPLATEIIGI